MNGRSRQRPRPVVNTISIHAFPNFVVPEQSTKDTHWPIQFVQFFRDQGDEAQFRPGNDKVGRGSRLHYADCTKELPSPTTGTARVDSRGDSEP